MFQLRGCQLGLPEAFQGSGFRQTHKRQENNNVIRNIRKKLI
jgi:hypothetical protein